MAPRSHLFPKSWNWAWRLKRELDPQSKKRMVERETLPRIPNIMAIWYLMAVTGELPERICPVMRPGKKTIPIPNMEFKVGIKAASKVRSTIGFMIA